MKLQSPTLILLFVAIALGGVVAVTELRQPNASTTEERQSLFDFEEDAVQTLTVETPEHVLQFEQEDDQWQMRSPDESPADAASVAFLLNLMATGGSDRVLDVASSDLDDFGFNAPLAEVEVTLDNEDTHRLILGTYDFNNSNIYARTISSGDSGDSAATNDTETDEADTNTGSNTDSPDGADSPDRADSPDSSVDVFVLPPSFDTAVNRPVEDWKQAPEPETTTDAQEGPETDSNSDTSAVDDTVDGEAVDSETVDAEAVDTETTDNTESAPASSSESEGSAEEAVPQN